MCFRFIVMHVSELSKPFQASSSSASSPSVTTTTVSATQAEQDGAGSAHNTPNSRLKNKRTMNIQYFGLKNLCQIYEICMYYLNNEDNRIVTASLECLQLLVKLSPLKFGVYLTKSSSISTRSHLKSKISLFLLHRSSISNFGSI